MIFKIETAPVEVFYVKYRIQEAARRPIRTKELKIRFKRFNGPSFHAKDV